MNKPRPIDYGVVRKLASIGCTDREIAAVTGFCHEWICKRKKKDNLLAEAIEHGRENGKATLRRMQWSAATNGNPTMLIWLGKQMLGQRDRHELSGDQDNPLHIVRDEKELSDAELQAIASGGIKPEG